MPADFNIPSEEYCAYNPEEHEEFFNAYEDYKHDVELFYEAYEQLEELL